MPIVCKILDEIYLNSSFSALYKKLIFILPEELVGEYKLKTDFYNDPNNAEISEIILRKLITSSNNITDAVYRICHQVPENEYCKNLLGTDGAHLLYKVAEFDIFG